MAIHYCTILVCSNIWNHFLIKYWSMAKGGDHNQWSVAIAGTTTNGVHLWLGTLHNKLFVFKEIMCVVDAI